MTPSLGIFMIHASKLVPYQGAHSLTTMATNAPLSVVAISEK
jgi:hypothetical protein